MPIGPASHFVDLETIRPEHRDTPQPRMPRYGWSTSRLDWDVAHALVVVRQFGKVPLQLAMQGIIPQTSGVYVVCSGPNGADDCDLLCTLYTVLYVGQSTNLRARFIHHLTAPTGMATVLSAFDRLEFWYTPIPESELNLVEGAIQRALGPPANKINAPSFAAKLSAPIPANP